MKEVMLTSSVLILAVLLLRVLFRKSISRRVQYALWLVVAVRLLLPVSLPALPFSVLSSTQSAQSSLDTALTERSFYVLPVGQSPISAYPQADGVRPGERIEYANSFGYLIMNQDGASVTLYAEHITLTQALTWSWFGGMALTGLWFLISNLRLSRKLRKVKTPYATEGCSLPVFVAEGLASPCLFGLLHPAIYLTPAAVASPEILRHVLAHEESHYAQKDQLWALLRCVCLAVHWYNPLVWVAAVASRADCELACDERAVGLLGESERLSYGHTLLSLIPVGGRPTSPLLTATTMTSGKRALTDRIRRIAENKHTVTAALFLALALVVVVCTVTFTGAKGGVTWADEADIAAGKPHVTVSLDDLSPYTPARPELGQSVSAEDIAEKLNGIVYGRFQIFYYKSVDGSYYAAYSLADSDDEPIVQLAKMPENVAYKSLQVAPFADPLLGQDGFMLHYTAAIYDGDTPRASMTRDYFTVSGDSYPTPLVLSTGVSLPRDLNGDGKDELVNYGDTYGFYFESDGKIYYADVNALLRQISPEQSAVYTPYYENRETGHMLLYHTDDQGKRSYRTVHFNGGALEIWLGDTRQTADHAITLRSSDTQVHSILDSDQVISVARDVVQGLYNDANAASPELGYDDWRIESLTWNGWGQDLVTFRMNYELHTANPENVPLTPEGYRTEDGWVSPGKPSSTYLAFLPTRSWSEITAERRKYQQQKALLQDVMMEMLRTEELTFLKSITIEGDYLEDADYALLRGEKPLPRDAKLEVTREGIPESLDARQFNGLGFSILIPKGTWSLSQDFESSYRWRVAEESDLVHLTVRHWQSRTADYAVQMLTAEEIPGFGFEDITSLPPEDFGKPIYGHNSDLQRTVMLYVYQAQGGVYTITLGYPDEYTEGYGAVLAAMADSFQLEHPAPVQ